MHSPFLLLSLDAVAQDGVTTAFDALYKHEAPLPSAGQAADNPDSYHCPHCAAAATTEASRSGESFSPMDLIPPKSVLLRGVDGTKHSVMTTRAAQLQVLWLASDGATHLGSICSYFMVQRKRLICPLSRS